MKLYQKLRLLREEKGLTQQALASTVGIGIQSVRNYEKEDLNRMPNTVQLKILKDFYNVTYEYLLNEDCMNRQTESVDIGQKLKLSDEAIDSILDIQRVAGEIVDDTHPAFNIVKENTSAFSNLLEKIDITEYICLIKEYEILNKLYEILWYFSSFDKLNTYIFNCIKNNVSLDNILKLLDEKSKLVNQYIKKSVHSGLDDNSLENLNKEIKKFKDFCKKADKEKILYKDVDYITGFVSGIGEDYQEQVKRSIRFCLFEITDMLTKDLNTNYEKLDVSSIPSEYKNILKKEGN